MSKISDKMSNIGDKWKKRRSDVFIRAQNQLMWFFSGIIILFLLIFISTAYIFVQKSVNDAQRDKLEFAASSQNVYMRKVFIDQQLSELELETIQSFRSREGLFFYYIADARGKLIFREEAYEQQQQEILDVIREWKPNQYQTRKVKISKDFSDAENREFTIPENSSNNHENVKRKDREERDHEESNDTEFMDSPLFGHGDHDSHLLIAAKPMYVAGDLLGMMYMGIDISSSNDVFFKLLRAFLILGLIFSSIVFPLSILMSRKAMKPIRESLIRQREFVTDASHELRTPLSILHSSLDVVEEEDRGRLSQLSTRVLADMRDEVRRMAKLVSDLLTLARADSGHPQLQVTRYDVVLSLGQVIRNAHTLSQAKDIRVELAAFPSQIITADQQRIEQLMYILVENAITYTPHGGTIRIEVSHIEHARIPSIEIQVTDSGMGIPEDDLSKIFERFYRVDKHRSKRMGGSGLGLSIAQWIVDAHDGSISVNSEIGKGTSFTVTLPVDSRIIM